MNSGPQRRIVADIGGIADRVASPAVCLALPRRPSARLAAGRVPDADGTAAAADAAYHAARSAGKIGSSPMHVKRSADAQRPPDTYSSSFCCCCSLSYFLSRTTMYGMRCGLVLHM